MRLFRQREAQHDLAAYKIYLDAALQVGSKTADTPIIIADVKNEPYAVPLGQFYQLFFTYGVACEAFFQNYLIAFTHLQAAITSDEVAAVQLPI